MTKLSELGWKFEVISCLDKDKYAQKLRQKNYFICLVMSLTLLIVPWTSQLVKSNTYLTDIKERDYYWIEDSVDHAESGKRVGLNSIVMDHPYNKEWDGPRVKNWKDIYQIITHDSTH